MAVIPLTPEQQEAVNRSLQKQARQESEKSKPPAVAKDEVAPTVTSAEAESQQDAVDFTGSTDQESTDSTSFKSYKKRK